jgi:hypothetical protein
VRGIEEAWEPMTVEEFREAMADPEVQEAKRQFAENFYRQFPRSNAIRSRIRSRTYQR